MTPQQIGETILAKQRSRDLLKFEIAEIAKAHIPDFHFLNYAVSTFWTCDRSPIGMCVWTLVEGRGKPFAFVTCRYCGGPVERK